MLKTVKDVDINNSTIIIMNSHRYSNADNKDVNIVITTLET